MKTFSVLCRCLSPLSALFLFQFSPTTVLSAADRDPSWTRGFLDGTGSHPFVPFRIATASDSNSHLRASFQYSNYSDSNEDVEVVSLEATKTSDGYVWLTAKLQVREDERTGWKTVGESRKEGDSVVITVPPKTASPLLYVEMDCFRPFIGTAKFGRIVLMDGKTATFDLDNLRPPK
jgi:hypothetical protein